MSAWIGPAIIAAFISSIVTIVGWIVAYRGEKRAELERRQERIKDVQSALRAEIRSNRANLAALDLKQHAEEMAAFIRGGADPNGNTPFVPRESHSSIYNALVKDIHVLPSPVVDPVVLYYTQIMTIAQFVDDLRSDRYQELDKERKVRMYDDYIELRIYALRLADRAIAVISRSLEDSNVQ